MPLHPTSWATILISPIYIWFFQVSISLRSLTKILHAFLLSPIRVTCTVHLILLDLITLNISWGIQTIKFLIM
jgi:hypothetical protein